MPDSHIEAMRLLDSRENIAARRPMVHHREEEEEEEEEEPEIDHPPQSMSLMNVSNAGGDNNISGHTQGNDADHEMLEGDDTAPPPRSSDICRRNVVINHRSNDSDDSAERAPSAVGSTVSVMGSAAGDDGDYSSAQHDDARLLAVRMRMMQDVEEVSEGGIMDEEEDERENYGESAANDSTHDDDDNLNDISLECHADTNTSYVEDHSIIADARSAERDADTSNNSEDRSMNDAGWTERETNVVKVADFSDSSTVVDANGRTPPPIHNIHVAHESQSRQGQESPFRAAFRRSAQEMSNRLPLMSPQMLSAAAAAAAAATPGRFQRSAAASSAMDRAATTASLLPQFARQCFSFEDTTVDDDFFLAVPDRLRAGGGGGGGGGEGGHATTHEYYGLSAVASFVVGEHDDDDDDGLTNDDDRHHRAGCGATAAHESRASSSGRHGHSSCGGGGELDSPFRVIRESRTWGGDVPQSSSLDAWSRARGGPNQHLGGGINGTVDSCPIEKGKRNSAEKDRRVSAVSNACHILIAD
jgi:hypothetical protein